MRTWRTSGVRYGKRRAGLVAVEQLDAVDADRALVRDRLALIGGALLGVVTDIRPWAVAPGRSASGR